MIEANQVVQYGGYGKENRDIKMDILRRINGTGYTGTARGRRLALLSYRKNIYRNQGGQAWDMY